MRNHEPGPDLRKDGTAMAPRASDQGQEHSVLEVEKTGVNKRRFYDRDHSPFVFIESDYVIDDVTDAR